MTKRRTVLIIQPGFCGLSIQRGRTADLYTCPRAAAVLGISLKWVHRYARDPRRTILYQLGRPLLRRAEVAHLQRWLAHSRRARLRQGRFQPLVTRRRPVR